MTNILNLMNTENEVLWTVLVAAFVSVIVSYLFKILEFRKSAQIDYEYEQKRKLSELIGRYHGQLVGASSRLNLRMWNLYEHHDEKWLFVDGKFDPDNYYFKSTVFRFMEVFSLVREVEKQAILLDNRIASKRDHLFLNYCHAMSWLMSDTSIEKDQTNAFENQIDHFFLITYAVIVTTALKMENFLCWNSLGN